MTWRRFGSLLKQLPRTSRFVRALIGEEHVRWGETERILADLTDLVATLNRNLVQQGSKHTIPKPQPYPRPWVTEKPETLVLGAGPGMTPDELHDYLRRPRVEIDPEGR